MPIEGNQFLRALNPQRAEENRVDGSEDRGVGADAKRRVTIAAIVRLLTEGVSWSSWSPSDVDGSDRTRRKRLLHRG
jgi:hypothetical protein